MKQSLNVFVILRVLLGLFFILVSLQKLLHPYQNFLYVVQSYQVFPSSLEKIIAIAMPWVEFLMGVFLLLGFWLKKVLPLFLILFCGFLLLIGQAIIRKLPLDSCGCFGDWITVSPKKTFLFDSVMFIFTATMLMNVELTAMFGLDRYFRDTK